VRGEVLYHRHEDKGVRQLDVGTRLNNGDIVFTTDTSYAEWSLTPDSYLRVANDSRVQVYETSLNHMRFDVMRADVLITLRSLENGTSLEINTPPALLTISKPGIYRIVVAANGETDADVGKGELNYVDSQGKLKRVKKGRRVHFYKAESNNRKAKGSEKAQWAVIHAASYDFFFNASQPNTRPKMPGRLKVHPSFSPSSDAPLGSNKYPTKKKYERPIKRLTAPKKISAQPTIFRVITLSVFM
jgi:hypothetical protein